MWIYPSNGNVTLYVMRNLVPLNNAITIFNNKNPLLIIFVYFITTDGGTCHFLYFDSRLSVEANHMVVCYWAIVVLSHNQDSIQPVGSYADIFTNRGFT